ncbi:MAG TPA: hypothetical protein VJJ83_05245, partial [Candidatus Babeliales bacterium]|nr:hypothetical protein [Candidatus Babeliales bacterium]
MRLSRHFLLPALALITYGFLYFPILVLIWFSFYPAPGLTAAVTGFSWTAYERLWGNPELLVA